MVFTSNLFSARWTICCRHILKRVSDKHSSLLCQIVNEGEFFCEIGLTKKGLENVHQQPLSKFDSPVSLKLNLKLANCGLYCKCFTIIIYNHNDSGQYYKTTITIVIDDPS